MIPLLVVSHLLIVCDLACLNCQTRDKDNLALKLLTFYFQGDNTPYFLHMKHDLHVFRQALTGSSRAGASHNHSAILTCAVLCCTSLISQKAYLYRSHGGG
jgi:hypothetical protein